MTKDELVFLGKITRHQGKKGGVRVIPYSSSLLEGCFGELILVAHGVGKKTLGVGSVHRMNKFVMIKFSSVEDMAEAKELVGSEIAVRRSTLRPLELGEFYWCDLTGLNVLDKFGNRLGQVEDIFETGSNEVFVIRDGEKEILIPAISEVVHSIDLEKGEMMVSPADFI